MDRGDELHVPLGGNWLPLFLFHKLPRLKRCRLLTVTWFLACFPVRRHTRRRHPSRGGPRQRGAGQSFDSVGRITFPVLVAALAVALVVLLLLRLLYSLQTPQQWWQRCRGNSGMVSVPQKLAQPVHQTWRSFLSWRGLLQGAERMKTFSQQKSDRRETEEPFKDCKQRRWRRGQFVYPDHHQGAAEVVNSGDFW